MRDTPRLKVTTPSDREIVMTRGFDAPRSLVFQALTTPDLVSRWMIGPDGWSMPVCEIELKVGGAIRHVWRGQDGAEIELRGSFREIEPPGRIVHSEIFEQDWTGGETVVTTVLTEEEGRTTVTMTILYSSKEARDGALKTGMEEGMATSYDRLAGMLAELAAG